MGDAGCIRESLPKRRRSVSLQEKGGFGKHVVRVPSCSRVYERTRGKPHVVRALPQAGPSTIHLLACSGAGGLFEA